MKSKIFYMLVSLTVLLPTVIGILGNFITNHPDLSGKVNQYSVFTLIISLVLFIFLFFIFEIFKFKHEQNLVRGDSETDFGEKNEIVAKRFYELLKKRYRESYLNKLDHRFEITLEVSKDWQSLESKKFTGHYEGSWQIEEAFDYIEKVFKEEGCLLIIGDSGVGKTVLLYKLAQKLLDETDINNNEPFPVILNLASWSEEFKDIEDWLASILDSSEGLAKENALKLLENNKLILFLDGLDELARKEDELTRVKIQARCLNSLYKYLDGGKKAVICCQNKQFLRILNVIGQKPPLIPVVKLLNLTKAEVLMALEKASTDIEHRISSKILLDAIVDERSKQFLNAFFKEIKSDKNIKRQDLTEMFLKIVVNKGYENLLEVLCTPFYFTTALEVFDDRTIKLNNLPEGRTALETFLIEKFTEKKLEEKPPKPRIFKNTYKMRMWLRWLAKYLKTKGAVKFELADLQPNDLRWAGIFKLFYGILVYLFTCFPITLLIIIVMLLDLFNDQKFKQNFADMVNISPDGALVILLSFILVVILFVIIFTGLPFCLLFGFRTKTIDTEDSNQLSLKPLLKWKTWKDIIFAGISYAVIFVIIFGGVMIPYPQTTIDEDLKNITISFLVIFFIVSIERITNYSRQVITFKGLQYNYQRLRRGILYNIIRLNLVIFIIIFAANLFSKGMSLGEYSFRLVLLFLPFVLIITVLNTALFKHFVLRMCLVISNKIPFRFAKFLDYAEKARILEKDGGHWRFRHQNLQNYFADLK